MESLLLILGLVLILTMIAAATWLVGFWNNVITWVNLMISALVASSFFEPLAVRLNENAPESTYLVDFVAIWGLFVATYGVLRIFTELFSRYKLQFDQWTETIGRTVMSVLIAFTFLAFASFTLHTAPLPVDGFWGNQFQPTPDARTLGIGMDRTWMGFVKTLSVGSMSEFKESRLLPPYDLFSESGVREFDPQGVYTSRYRQRREQLSTLDDIQIAD